MKKLNIIATIKDGVAIALVNYLSLILTALLYAITIWIPYINVGTTIAMESLPAEMAKGNVINPLFIFDGKYRRNMGEFLILMALMSGAIAIGLGFGFIPGFVIAIAWSFAVVLFVDKDMSALEALRESNRLTYGNKWRIFWAEFVLVICLGILTGIISALFGIGQVGWLMVIGSLINLVIVVFAIPAIIGVEASIYKQLTGGEILEGKDIKEELKDIKDGVAEAVKVEKTAEKAPEAEEPAPEASKAEEPAPEAPKAPKAPKASKAPKKE